MSFSLIDFGFVAEAKGATEGLMEQVHSSDVIEATHDSMHLPKEKADAVVTIENNLPIYIFTADCCPVLLASLDKNGPIAAIHSGWRGTMQGIIKKTANEYFSEPFRAIIGPCLLSCCFEVKEDFIFEFSNARGDISEFLIPREGRTYFDIIRFIVERELKGTQVSEIDTRAVRCTVCSEPKLPSYRRNRSTDPRIKAWITKRSQSLSE